MKTSNFKTRSEIISADNLKSQKYYTVALDIGYSAVKGMSPSAVFCFPSFVREKSGPMIGTPKDTDIYYKDEEGTVYTVGLMALEGLTTKDTDDASNTLYGRNRYFSPSFLILARIGIAIGMSPSKENGFKGNKPIFLQTGLPPAYRKGDTPLLIEALSGNHKFSVKIGNGNWTQYSFSLPTSNISVIDQPIGSVYSASKADDGTTVLSSNGKTLVDSKVLVLDGGFGTLDIFSVINRAVDATNTFSNLGMKAVFEHACEEILRAYRKEIHPHTLQNYLASGQISIFDKKSRSTTCVDFSKILEASNRKICQNAISKIELVYNNLEEYDYLLVTGGTGAAWLDIIKERYKGMTTLEIITGNQNHPTLDHIYSNVRGYYIYRNLARSSAV